MGLDDFKCRSNFNNLMLKVSLLHKIKNLLIFSILLNQSGFGQIRTDSTKTNKLLPYIAPTVLMMSGLVVQGTVSKELRDSFWQKNFPNFNNHTDDALAFSPLVLSLGLGAAGVKGKHEFGDQIILAGLSNVLSNGISISLKNFIRFERPDASNNYSFPSGHTTLAFTGATILNEEYGEKNLAYSIGGYTLATTTAAFRMLNNKHWLADVMFGAGIGIVSTKVVYAVYPLIQKKIFKNKKIAAMPTFSGNGTIGVYFVSKL
jgi:hypothetical protein